MAPDRKRDLATLAILAGGCALAGWHFGLPALYALAAAPAAVMPFPRPAAALAGAWLKFGAVLGGFNFRLLLSLFYFLVLTPAALVYRLFSGDTLTLRRPAPGASLFRTRGRTYTAADLEKPW